MPALTLSCFDIRGLLFLRYPRVQPHLMHDDPIFLRPSAANLALPREMIGQIRHASQTLPKRNPDASFWLLSIYLVRIRTCCFHVTRGEMEWSQRALPPLLCGGATRLHLLDPGNRISQLTL